MSSIPKLPQCRKSQKSVLLTFTPRQNACNFEQSSGLQRMFTLPTSLGSEILN